MTRWVDLSGNGNDAIQGIAAYAPAYNPTGIGGLPSATFTGPITFLSIGAPMSEFQQVHGDLAELIAARGLAPTDLANLEQYLKGRYRIP